MSYQNFHNEIPPEAISSAVREDWMFTIGDIIDLAIRIEKNGGQAYKKAGNQATNPALVSLLQWLAEEETEHEEWFKRLKSEMEIHLEDPQLDEMGNAVLQSVLGDQAFSIQEADFSKIDDLETLLRLSVEFEKDTLLFYEMLSAFIEDEKTLNQLNRIMEEENRHARLLTESLTSLCEYS